jgi:3-deoxy-D-manno-octulosonic-acid transferase
MVLRLVLTLYNLLLPLVVVLAAPAWVRRMGERGGLGPRLWERLGIFERDAEFEPNGGIYVHAVSVGEVMMALKLIRHWKERFPMERFVLAATTTTGFALADAQAPEGVRVIYSPVDFPWLIRRMFDRFDPRLIVMVDSEIWPNLLRGAEKRGVPAVLANARLSPRSARRYERFGVVAGPVLGMLRMVCVQAEGHARQWEAIGIAAHRIRVTGSVKFDQEGVARPRKREEFQEMVEAFGRGRPVVMAVSTHDGEEVRVAEALREHPEFLPVLVPRHAERRGVVCGELEAAGFEVVLRSRFRTPDDPITAVLVVDSTGELRDWTAGADVVVVGKSFLARGGQNPAEAIAAGLPVVCGPHMENFEPLITELREAGAVRDATLDSLGAVLAEVLGDARSRRAMTEAASAVLGRHAGATARTVDLLAELAGE